jgi:hypothetical protein
MTPYQNSRNLHPAMTLVVWLRPHHIDDGAAENVFI